MPKRSTAGRLPEWLAYNGRQLRYYLSRALWESKAFIPGLRAQRRREAMIGPFGHWRELRAYQIQALKQHGLQPQHRILDIGCGPLQGGIPMIQYLDPSSYVGVDINPFKLAEGYREVARHGLAPKNPQLFHSENFGAEHLDGQRFDFIWASQILYYFDDATLRNLLAFVAQKLAPDGKFLCDILGKCDRKLRSRSHLQWCRSVKRHSVKKFNQLGAPFGLQARATGRIDAFGYPRKLRLCSNVMIEVTHRQPPG
jgi:SAM-dependent methyltransferase